MSFRWNSLGRRLSGPDLLPTKHDADNQQCNKEGSYQDQLRSQPASQQPDEQIDDGHEGQHRDDGAGLCEDDGARRPMQIRPLADSAAQVVIGVQPCSTSGPAPAHPTSIGPRRLSITPRPADNWRESW